MERQQMNEREKILLSVFVALFICLVLILFLSHPRAPKYFVDTTALPPGVTENIEQNISDFVNSGLSILGSEDAIKATEEKFGKPLQIKTTMVDYAYNVPQHIYTYQGLIVTLVQNYDLSRAFVTRVELTNKMIPVLFNLRIGRGRKYVEAILGLPGDTPLNSEKYVYSPPEALAGNSAEIYFKRDRVSKIVWNQYLD
jgi:ribosomal protein L30E